MTGEITQITQNHSNNPKDHPDSIPENSSLEEKTIPGNDTTLCTHFNKPIVLDRPGDFSSRRHVEAKDPSKFPKYNSNNK